MIRLNYIQVIGPHTVKTKRRLLDDTVFWRWYAPIPRCGEGLRMPFGVVYSYDPKMKCKGVFKRQKARASIEVETPDCNQESTKRSEIMLDE